MVEELHWHPDEGMAARSLSHGVQRADVGDPVSLYAISEHRVTTLLVVPLRGLSTFKPLTLMFPIAYGHYGRVLRSLSDFGQT